MDSEQPKSTQYESPPTTIIGAPSPEPTRGTLSSRYQRPRLQNTKRDIPGEVIDAFHSSSWIWAAGDSAFAAPPGLTAERAFRISIPSPAGKVATTAMILITADSQYALFVNGILVGNGENTATVEIYGVTLVPTLNVFAVRGFNDIQNPVASNPAGLIAAIQISFSDGTTSLLQTDGSWRSMRGVPDKFEAPDFDDSEWANATVLVKYGGPPWGTSITFRTDTMFQIIALPSAALIGPTSAATESSLASRTPSEGAKVPVGGIVGGVIGGVILLLAIVAIILWRSKESRAERNRERGTDTSKIHFGHTIIDIV
ncbi:hypothetical protein BDZ94DRAFT_1309356 [Collybia nuda]|uniref:Lectin n=1 Tax=Collybia nuda TaxID=64659 RepID=A0A9P6CJI1_9AGAR|nr:hypothetical protein BDZ94DRAFT_1309356 [Collybia nuda]